MERGTETGERNSNGGLTEGKTKQASKSAVAKPDSDSKDDSKVGVLNRIGYGIGGFIFGILAAIMFIGYRFIVEPEWLSWPIAIIIAILMPGTFSIVAAWNAGWLCRFFGPRFWRRLDRFELGCMGMFLLFVGVPLLVIGIIEISLLLMLAASPFLAFGLWALWTALRGKDENVLDFLYP